MNVRLLLRLSLVAALWLAPVARPDDAAGVEVVATDGEGLRPDPAVVLGWLPNGLRYALRAQPVPPGRVSFCLHVAAGSREEREDEQGYAHFVEHMAFAGSRDFPGDAAIRTLQRYGLAFGSEVNAATGRTYTTYEIRNVPVANADAVATALRVLRNFADGVAFEPEAVARERGVILSERSVRAGRIAYWWGRDLEYLAPYRDEASDNEMTAVFADTSAGRSQLGTPRSLRQATPERLRAFHERWYRADRLTLAVAGEMDPAEFAGLVHAEFGSMAMPPPTVEPPPAAQLARTGRSRFRITQVTEENTPQETTTLVAAAPRRAEDTGDARRAELAEALAMQLLEQRVTQGLNLSAQIETALSHEIAGWTMPLLRVRATPGQWPAVATALQSEVQRALQHGFGPAEVAAEAESLQRRSRWSERDAASRSAVEVAAALAHTVGAGRTFAAAAEERRWTEATLAALTPEEVQAAVRRLWPIDTTQLVVSGPLAADEAQDAVVRRALEEIRGRRLPEFVPPVRTAVELPGGFGPAGAVVREERDPQLDCWLLEFDNGVRLNFKATPFEHGRVRVRVSFGHGLLGTEPGREGLAFAIGALYHGGTTDLSMEHEREVRELGEITVGFGFGADRLGLWATCPATEVDAALRLFAAHCVRPAFRPGGEAPTRAFIEDRLTSYDRTSAGVAEDRLREHLFGGHHALTRPRRQETETLSYADLRRWLEPQLAASPLEIAVVGDLTLEEAKAAVAHTFGALPRRTTLDQLADRRLFTPGVTPQHVDARFAGKRSVGSVALAWRLPDVVGQEDDCRMQLLSSVLEDRIRVRLRREMGKTYTPVVGLQSERALTPPMLYVRCRVETEPRQLDRVAEAAKAVVAELVREGISEEELERARPPLVRQAEDNEASNAWWLFVLGEAQSKPQFLEGQADRRRILRETRRPELNALARLLFAPERLCEVRAIPE